jgi:hypothetical protein
MSPLPPITLDSDVDPSDRISAIDFVNRVNWLFEIWDVDTMVEAFLPDSVTYHFHGINRGKVEPGASSTRSTRISYRVSVGTPLTTLSTATTTG